MGKITTLIISLTGAVVLAGCSQYEAGNRDRERCIDLRIGTARGEVVAHMGSPRSSRSPATTYAEEILVYNQPSMPDLPMFSGDKPVELLMERTPSGLVLKQALCSGVDG